MVWRLSSEAACRYCFSSSIPSSSFWRVLQRKVNDKHWVGVVWAEFHDTLYTLNNFRFSPLPSWRTLQLDLIVSLWQPLDLSKI